MARNGRMGLFAAAAAAMVIVSILMLWSMPADAEDSSEQALTYVSVGIFIVGLTLTGPVVYYMRTSQEESADREVEETEEAKEGAPSESSEVDEYITDIEREFQALEMEIEREERG